MDLKKYEKRLEVIGPDDEKAHPRARAKLLELFGDDPDKCITLSEKTSQMLLEACKKAEVNTPDELVMLWCVAAGVDMK